MKQIEDKYIVRIKKSKDDQELRRIISSIWSEGYNEGCKESSKECRDAFDIGFFEGYNEGFGSCYEEI